MRQVNCNQYTGNKRTRDGNKGLFRVLKLNELKFRNEGWKDFEEGQKSEFTLEEGEKENLTKDEGQKGETKTRKKEAGKDAKKEGIKHRRLEELTIRHPHFLSHTFLEM